MDHHAVGRDHAVLPREAGAWWCGLVVMCCCHNHNCRCCYVQPPPPLLPPLLALLPRLLLPLLRRQLQVGAHIFRVRLQYGGCQRARVCLQHSYSVVTEAGRHHRLRHMHT